MLYYQIEPSERECLTVSLVCLPEHLNTCHTHVDSTCFHAVSPRVTRVVHLEGFLCTVVSKCKARGALATDAGRALSLTIADGLFKPLYTSLLPRSSRSKVNPFVDPLVLHLAHPQRKRSRDPRACTLPRGPIHGAQEEPR